MYKECFACMYVSILCACPVPEEVMDPPVIGVTDSCELPAILVLGVVPGYLQEQKVLLITEPTLQPPSDKFFKLKKVVTFI